MAQHSGTAQDLPLDFIRTDFTIARSSDAADFNQSCSIKIQKRFYVTPYWSASMA